MIVVFNRTIIFGFDHKVFFVQFIFDSHKIIETAELILSYQKHSAQHNDDYNNHLMILDKTR